MFVVVRFNDLSIPLPVVRFDHLSITLPVVRFDNLSITLPVIGFDHLPITLVVVWLGDKLSALGITFWKEVSLIVPCNDLEMLTHQLRRQ